MKSEIDDLKISQKSFSKIEKEKLPSRNDELEKLKGDFKRTEKQINELMAVYNKQKKMIDLLKQQRLHLEGLKKLSFDDNSLIKIFDLHLNKKK